MGVFIQKIINVWLARYINPDIDATMRKAIFFELLEEHNKTLKQLYSVKTVTPETEINHRVIALKWWNDLSTAKRQECTSFYLPDRIYTSLTGREIQDIYEHIPIV